MAVDFTLPKKVLVIHGVQTGDGSDLTQHKNIEKILKQQLADYDLPFTTDIFKYEDINDRAQSLVKNILSALTGNKITGWIVSTTVDLVGDVALALIKGDAYKEITSEFKKRILKSYEIGEPVYIVAHSLGTIYAFDVVNDLMKDPEFFQYNKPETRPVQGLITLGSPISLDLFSRDWKKMTNLIPEGESITEDTDLFPWRNYWDPTDPIVSGSVAGLPWDEQAFDKRFGDKPYDLGWDLRSRSVITGSGHLLAHTAYWDDASVNLGIRQILSRG